MFGKLREKLAGLFKKKVVEPAKKEKDRKEIKKTVKKKEIKKEKKEVEEKVIEEEIKAIDEADDVEEIKQEAELEEFDEKDLPSEEELKKQADEMDEVVPTEFEVGELKHEPDLEAIREKGKDLPREKNLSSDKQKSVGSVVDLKEELEEKREGNKLDSLSSIEGNVKQERKGVSDSDEIGETGHEVIEEKVEESEVEQEVIEEEKEEKVGFFGRLAKKLTTSELKQEGFDEFFEEFEMTLLENNVALGVVDKIRGKLGEELVGMKFGKKEVGEKIGGALRNAIGEVLIEGS